ncbi:hypothetical protein ACFWOJ_14640 [Streptomyces sp. NPDC058439]|uniref:hypothetical protein n=1 Tax=Streptomyces sp. NPDC058439 TaxID=3346500 RepID=UPI00365CF1F3
MDSGIEIDHTFWRQRSGHVPGADKKKSRSHRSWRGYEYGPAASRRIPEAFPEADPEDLTALCRSRIIAIKV